MTKLNYNYTTALHEITCIETLYFHANALQCIFTSIRIRVPIIKCVICNQKTKMSRLDIGFRVRCIRRRIKSRNNCDSPLRFSIGKTILKFQFLWLFVRTIIFRRSQEYFWLWIFFQCLHFFGKLVVHVNLDGQHKTFSFLCLEY